MTEDNKQNGKLFPRFILGEHALFLSGVPYMIRAFPKLLLFQIVGLIVINLFIDVDYLVNYKGIYFDDDSGEKF